MHDVSPMKPSLCEVRDHEGLTYVTTMKQTTEEDLNAERLVSPPYPPV